MADTMTRAEIRDAQRMLNRLGIRDDRGRPLRVDGIMGPRTAAALASYRQQQSHPAGDPSMPLPQPNGHPANRSMADRLMPPLPTLRPQRLTAQGGTTSPTPGYDPLEGIRPRPPMPGFMFGGPSAGAPPMAPPMGGGMSGMGMAGGAGPQPYQFSGPPMVPDQMQSPWGNPAGLMDAAQMAQGGPSMGLPDRGYIPPPDSFAAAGGPPMQPQGPSDQNGLMQMIAGIQSQAAQGQGPNIQPGAAFTSFDRGILDPVRIMLGMDPYYPEHAAAIRGRGR